jgi:DNA-binding transcriptional LysR family regulator
MADRWPGIELRHLAAFRAVARERSFHAAGTRLGYTQSAISQQVAALERAVGARLVIRPGGPKPVTLTEAGKLLLRHAEAISARLAAAQADLATFLEGREGLLRIGAYQSVGARIIPAVLKRLGRERRALEVQLTRRRATSSWRRSWRPVGSISRSRISRCQRGPSRRSSCCAIRMCWWSRPNPTSP